MRDGAAYKVRVSRKGTAFVIKCNEHSALGFGSDAPLSDAHGVSTGALG